jgi:hypothetical protein
MTILFVVYGILCLWAFRIGFRMSWENDLGEGYEWSYMLSWAILAGLACALVSPITFAVIMWQKFPKPSAEKIGNAVAGKSKARKVAEGKKT